MDHKLISSTIIEALEKSGALQYDELFTKVESFHNKLNDTTFQDFIMEMELKGLIRVYDMARGIRRIEIA